MKRQGEFNYSESEEEDVSVGVRSDSEVEEEQPALRRRRGFRKGAQEREDDDYDVIIEEIEDEEDTIRNERETKEAEEAAVYAHLLPYDMSAIELQEMSAFIDHQDIYFQIRNDILTKFRRHVNRFLTLAQARVGFMEDYLSSVDRVYDFLNQFGFINSGIVQNVEVTPTLGAGSRKSIIVIGAGMSGVAAARKLKSFGHSVKILEGRSRVGGRCHSETTIFDGPVDLGASIITGLKGNPITLLANQSKDPLYHIRTGACPIYKPDGKVLNEELDARIEKEFNRLLDSTAELRKRVSQSDYECKAFLGGELDSMSATASLSQYASKYSENSLPVWMPIPSYTIETHFKHAISPIYLPLPLDWLKDNSDRKQEFPFGSNGEILQLYSSREIKKLSLLEGLYLVRVAYNIAYTDEEQALFHWHVSNLEYANASDLNHVSMVSWDQDDLHDFSGAHCMLPKGYSSLVKQLAEDVQVEFENKVTKIEYDNKVTVTAIIGENKEEVKYDADLVLVTVPLGVLKSKAIDFQPSLPSWKSGCIERFGFGLLNKVVLKFPHVFWNHELDMWGTIQDDSSNAHPDNRGFYYMFWNLEPCIGQPVLIALVSGPSAYMSEAESTETLVNGAFSTLKKIYGEDIPNPIASHRTRWYSDEFSKGTYSYIGIGSTGDEYDILARPVDDKIFFAGEATWRFNPSTVAGAFLSGVRAAAVIENLGKVISEVVFPKTAIEAELLSLGKKIDDRRKLRSASAIFVPDYSKLLLQERIAFEREKQAARELLRLKQEEEKNRINDIVMKLLSSSEPVSRNAVAKVTANIGNTRGFHAILNNSNEKRVSALDSDFSIIKARVLAPDPSLPFIKSFQTFSKETSVAPTKVKSKSHHSKKHKSSSKAVQIDGSSIPSDHNAQHAIASFIKKSLTSLTVNDRLSRDTFKEIARKCTEKVYEEWLQKRKKWTEFFHEGRQGKIVGLIVKYLEKKNTRATSSQKKDI